MCEPNDFYLRVFTFWFGLGMCEPNDFYLRVFTFWFDTEKALFQVIWGLLLVYAD